MTARTHPSLRSPDLEVRRSHDRSLRDRLTRTDPRYAFTIARVGLGAVMFPHGAQKVLGWFGGTGFGSSYTFFVSNLHVPAPLAVFAILAELVASVALVLGLLTRVAAFVVLATMVAAIALVHAPNGFFMNWYGAKQGEGFEYHLLAATLAIVCLFCGGGRLSIDRALLRRP